MEQSSFTEGVAGSSVANIILVVLFFVGRFIQQRCTKGNSKCASHLGICDCETNTSLEDVRQKTQRVIDVNHKQLQMLEELHSRFITQPESV